MKILSLWLLLFSVSAFAQEQIAIELVVDESGVLLEAEDAAHYKLLLLSHLKALSSKRAGAKAKVEVISTSLGRTVWSGTPLSLRREPLRAQELVEAIAADPARCNNLPGAFRELESNLAQLEREGVSEVHIVVFSSLVDTPRPCADITRITLPQLPPAEGDIPGALVTSLPVRSVSFFWVSPHQKFVWEGFLKNSFDALRTQGTRVEFLDVERTKARLHSSPFTEGGAP